MNWTVFPCYIIWAVDSNMRGISPLENTILLKGLVVLNYLVANFQYLYEVNETCSIRHWWRSCRVNGFKKNKRQTLSTLMFPAVVQKDKSLIPVWWGLICPEKGDAKAVHYSLSAIVLQGLQRAEVCGSHLSRVNVCGGDTWAGQSRLPWLPKISSKSRNTTSENRYLKQVRCFGSWKVLFYSPCFPSLTVQGVWSSCLRNGYLHCRKLRWDSTCS